MKKRLIIISILSAVITSNNYQHYQANSKDSIEPMPHCPSTELYNDIYIKNATMKYFITQYLKPQMDLFSTIKVYYDFIINNFNISQVAHWYPVDFEKIAMVIYDSIGQINDYLKFYHPPIGIILLTFHASSSHVDFILKSITNQ